MKIFFLLVLALSLALPLTFAATPRLNPAGSGTETDPYIISNPDAAQIFFGELHGSPVYYKFIASAPLALYLQLLSPYSNGYDANANRISLYMATESRIEVAFIYEDSFFPSTYFEKSGGDYYFAGPEVKRNLSAGTYVIKLYSTTGTGKYALAIGTKEEVSVNSLVAIILAKQQIFAQPIAANFLQLLGLMIISACVAALYFASIVSKKSKETNRIVVDFYYKIRYVVFAGIVLTLAGWYPVYSTNPSSILGTAKTFILILIAAHWAYFFAMNNKKFSRIREKRALLAPKFQNSISSHMVAQMIKIVIVLILTAIII